MTVLVIAEHDNRTLAGATLRTVTAGLAFGQDVEILVAGQDCGEAAAAAARIPGAARVLCADGPALGSFLAEPLAALVAALVADPARDFDVVAAAANTFGKNLLPRVAGLLDLAMVSDVIEIRSANTFVRPIYAGNALATVECLEPVKILSVRPAAFDPAPAEGGGAVVDSIPPPEPWTRTRLVRRAEPDRSLADLGSARIVLGGGRGMQTAGNFAILARIAAKLGAAVGGTRAAVDAGFLANDLQVGQSGKVVAPDLYIAVGISGAIQHLAGIRGSKVIVAINTDENAPIFQAADYCLVADASQALPELEAALAGTGTTAAPARDGPKE